MAETKQMKTALVSVFHKDGLEELLAKLHQEGVKFLSTGGTQQFIESLGYACRKVEDLTTYPSILGGRVKTLHPKVFGGILARRDNEGDRQQMQEYEISAIDLVIVDQGFITGERFDDFTLDFVVEAGLRFVRIEPEAFGQFLNIGCHDGLLRDTGGFCWR